MELTFTIDGQPVAKQRPRSAADGHFYTPSRTLHYERDVATTYLAAGGVKRPNYKGPVQMHIAISRPRPTSWPGWRLRATTTPTVKPDVENVAKSIMDGLAGVAYHDDAQVVYLSVAKEWGPWRVTVTIETEDDDDL